MPDSVSVTMVNHVALDIDASPDEIWHVVLNDYLEMKALRDSGAVETLDDPAAIFGGYRICLEQGGTVDERIIHITERDEDGRRLSLTADYLSFPGAMRVYATYHAQETASGTRYAIDCHTQARIDVPGKGAREEVAQALAEMTAGADAHLLAYLAGVKARIEEGG